MTLPQQTNPRGNREAKAPYNFVPLPEHVLWAEELPTQDVYHPGRHTGWLGCTLTTASPLYVRCGLLPEQVAQEIEAKDRPDFFYTDPTTMEPVIPGSSLRGMLRALVEIVSYSKVQPVTDTAKMTFRAVAAPKDDPLTQPYQDVLGKYGRDVKAGYVEKRGDDWFIRPARRPSDLGLPGKDQYLKVKDRQIPNGAIQGLIRFKSNNYHPQYHMVSFDTRIGRGKRGKYVRVVDIGPADAGGRYQGVLVCSGNMAESGEGASSKRKNYALVLERNSKAKPIPINKQAVQDYTDTLTEFQKEKPFSERWGCLVDGRPVFYIQKGKEVIAFGHCPNFRVPAWLPGSNPKRAATPLDFVPEELRDSNQTDLAEAIFGYVEEDKKAAREAARRGRIAVTDAALEAGQDNVWFDPAQPVVIPKILASPKPTTFQHYLVQENDRKKSLAHYGSKPGEETVIRGHKLYWHKRDVDREFFEDEDFRGQSTLPKGDTQHTTIKPVRPDLRFRFHIHFENLSDVELGALLWLLGVADDDGYRFKLGMGKPLGLGSVKIKADLHLTDRQVRYTQLLADDDWATGDVDTVVAREASVKAFEQRMLKDPVLNPNKAVSLREVSRIQMLLFLLSWQGPDTDKTRYQEIEYGPNKDNEYKDRPILPLPSGVVKKSDPVESSPASTKKPPPSKSALKRKPKQEATTKPVSSKITPGEYTGIVTYFNLKHKKGRILPDGSDVEIEIQVGQLRPDVRYLVPDQKVSFVVVQDDDGFHLKNIGPI